MGDWLGLLLAVNVLHSLYAKAFSGISSCIDDPPCKVRLIHERMIELADVAPGNPYAGLQA